MDVTADKSLIVIKHSFQLLGIYRGKNSNRNTRCYSCFMTEKGDTLSSEEDVDCPVWRHQQRVPERLLSHTRQLSSVRIWVSNEESTSPAARQRGVYAVGNCLVEEGNRGGGKRGTVCDEQAWESLRESPSTVAPRGQRNCDFEMTEIISVGTSSDENAQTRSQGDEGSSEEILRTRIFSRSTDCAVCKSLHWDGDAKPIRQAEDEVLMTVAFLVTANWVCDLFGRSYQVMQLTSFLTYWSMLCAPTAFCLHAHLVSYVVGGRYPRDVVSIGGNHMGWYPILHQDYVTRRLQYLSTAAKKRLSPWCWLAVAVLWPVCNMALEMVFGQLAHRDAWGYVEIVTAPFLSFVFVIFCMFLSLVRTSFEYELEVDLAFVLRHNNCLDWCRKRISETYHDLQVFNRSVYLWMLALVNLGILGLTLHITWNYLALSYKLSDEDLTSAILLDLFITSEKGLVLFLPIVALHSFTNLDYLLTEFRATLSRHRCQCNEFFWDGLIRHVDTLIYRNFKDRIHLKTLLTVSCLYMGLRIGSQNWNYHGFVQTTTTAFPPLTKANNM